MDAILTYLSGDVTGFDIIVVVGGWLLFNAGFAAGAAWKGSFKRKDDAIARRKAPRCYPRVRV